MSQMSQMRMTANVVVRTALPYILAGGAIGALIGSVARSPVNGIRVGLVLGGVVAFVVIRRKTEHRS